MSANTGTNNPVNQNIVYSFRSICTDIGAHYGLIISKKGFQSGAEETRKATNIHLLNFEQFQETFYEEWKHGVMIKFAKMYDRLIPLMPINPDSPIDWKKHNPSKVYEKYSIFWGENRYDNVFMDNIPFPIEITDPRGEPNNLSKIKITTPREYFEIGKSACSDACKFFDI